MRKGTGHTVLHFFIAGVRGDGNARAYFCLLHFIIERTISLGSLLIASGSPVLLQATCKKANLTDTSHLIDQSLDNLYTCAIIGYRAKTG